MASDMASYMAHEMASDITFVMDATNVEGPYPIYIVSLYSYIALLAMRQRGGIP